jgi:hypothetical protein
MKKNKNIILALIVVCGLFLNGVFLNSILNFNIAQAATDASLIMTPKTQTIIPGETTTVEIIISNPSRQNIVTAGFDINFPSNALEIVDGNTKADGIQISTENSDFSLHDPALNIVSNTNGTINFTAASQGTHPLNAAEIKVASIQFKAKTNIPTQIAKIEFATNPNTDIFIKNEQGDSESIMSSEESGLQNADIVISNISYSVNPSYDKIDFEDDFSVDLILNNPDQQPIIAYSFELTFDDHRIKNTNNGNKLTTNSPSGYSMQVAENEIRSGDTLIFTAGFADGTPFTGTSLTIGTLYFEGEKSGTANIQFSENPSSSKVHLENDPLRNFLGSTNPGKFKIGDGDDEAPSSWATPKGGTFTEAQNVTLSTNDSDADIYFTLDGSTPTDRTTKYRGVIAISSDTTLRFRAIDEEGNEEGVNTEIYKIGGIEQGKYAIGVTAVKSTLAPGETTGVIVKLIDSSIHQAVPSKTINISNSGGGLIEAVGSFVTDEEGEILLNYTAAQSPGIDIITAILEEDTSIQGYLNLETIGNEIARIILVGSSLSTTKTNFISATLENNEGIKTSQTIPVELTVNKQGTSETKYYNANTVSGIATFAIPGSDFSEGETYDFIARANGLESNKITLSTEAKPAPIPQPRPGGGQPSTGPVENIFILFILSMVGVFFFKKNTN